MVIEYVLSLDDIIAFNLFHHRHSPILRRSRLFLQFGVPVICFLISIATTLVLTGRVFFSFGFFSPLIVLSFFWIPLSPFLYWWSIKRHIRRVYSEGKNKEIFGKRELSLTEEAVIDKSQIRETKTRWSGIEKVAWNDDYAFIYTAASMAYIIPREAFPDETMFKEFVETARQYHKNSVTA